MKQLPDWEERIPLIRAALTKITTEFIDQRQIGELFAGKRGITATHTT